jgi:PBP1b-binding outer membrane lipoprotein LpoB
MKNLILVILSSFFVASCSTTTCANDHKFDAMKLSTKNVSNESVSGAKMTLDKSQLNMKKIKVAKPDGTLQCSQGKEISIADMQKDLKAILVFSSANQTDGMIRIQMCGTPTGHHNVYEILESDLAEAIKYGFSVWKR